MRHPSNDNVFVFAPPFGKRRCPACGEVMNLSLIEPTYQHGYDIRTFECSKCAYAELVLVNSEEVTGANQASAGAIQHEIVKLPKEDGAKEKEEERAG